MSIQSTIWLEPDDDLYDAPLSDLALRNYLHANGIDPDRCAIRTDADKWRWFEGIPAPASAAAIDDGD